MYFPFLCLFLIIINNSVWKVEKRKFSSVCSDSWNSDRWKSNEMQVKINDKWKYWEMKKVQSTKSKVLIKRKHHLPDLVSHCPFGTTPAGLGCPKTPLRHEPSGRGGSRPSRTLPLQINSQFDSYDGNRNNTRGDIPQVKPRTLREPNIYKGVGLGTRSQGSLNGSCFTRLSKSQHVIREKAIFVGNR